MSAEVLEYAYEVDTDRLPARPTLSRDIVAACRVVAEQQGLTARVQDDPDSAQEETYRAIRNIRYEPMPPQLLALLGRA